MDAVPEMVKVPPIAGPCETQTSGLTADQRESMRSTFAWCRKKIGSNPEGKLGQKTRSTAVATQNAAATDSDEFAI